MFYAKSICQLQRIQKKSLSEPFFSVFKDNFGSLSKSSSWMLTFCLYYLEVVVKYMCAF